MGLGYVLTAKDLASGVLRDLRKHFVQLDAAVQAGDAHMTKAFTHIGKSMGILLAGLAPLGAAIANAVHAGGFTQGLAAVGAAANATRNEMLALHDAALAAGVETQFSPTEAVGGLVSLATAGQTATDAIRTLRPALDLAAASLGQLNVDQAAEAVVGTLNSYAWGAERAGEVTDKLVAIGNLTNFQAKDLGVGLSRAAEAGSLFGQSLDDVLIGMGLLRNRNIAADVASTALRNAMIRVNSDLRSQSILMRAGVPLRDKYTGQLRSILDVMSEFALATRHLDPLSLHPLVKEIFGEEGMPAFSAIRNATFTSVESGIAVTRQGTDAIAALRRELSKAGGAAATFVRRYNDNFAGQVTLLRGTIQGLATAVGESFGEVLAPVLKAVRGALNALLEAFVALPRPVKQLCSVLVLGTATVVAIGAAAAAANLAWAGLSAAFAAVGATLAPLAAALGGVIATIGWPLAALGVAVGSFVAAYRVSMAQSGRATREHGGQLLTFWRGLGQVIETGALSGNVLERLTAAPWLKSLVVGAYNAYAAFRGLWGGIKDGFSHTAKFLAPVFNHLQGSLDALGQTASHLAHFVGKGLGKVAPYLAIGLRGLGWVIGGTLAAVGTAVAALVDLLVYVPRAVLGSMERLISAFLQGWRSIPRVAASLGNALAQTVAAWWSRSGLAAWCRRVRTLLPLAFKVATRQILHLARGLVSALSKTMGALGAVFSKPLDLLPTWLKPAVLVHSAPTAQAEPVAPFPEHPRAAESGARALLPTVAEVRARTPPEARPTAVPSRERDIPVHVEVKLDGEAIARATAKARREFVARQFRPLLGIP